MLHSTHQHHEYTSSAKIKTTSGSEEKLFFASFIYDYFFQMCNHFHSACVCSTQKEDISSKSTEDKNSQRKIATDFAFSQILARFSIRFEWRKGKSFASSSGRQTQEEEDGRIRTRSGPVVSPAE